MDALAAEIARKRKAQVDAKAAIGGSASGARKWVKKGDLEQLRVNQYHEAEALAAEERSKKLVAPQFRVAAELDAAAASADAQDEGSAAAGSATGSSTAAAARAFGSRSDAPAEQSYMKPAEVKRALRGLNQPIHLFGEEEDERLERYRAVSALLPSESVVNDQLKAGQMFDETQLFDESGRAKQEGTAAAVPAEVGKGAQEDDEDEDEDESFVATTPEQLVSRHFKTLLKMWGAELAERSEAETSSNAGRTATAAFQQAKRHLRPFFKFLRMRAMPLDVLSTMVEITTFMQQREYVRAHDAYIKCAIGTAPWPMGITGTGIHERQGRQHLRESKVAHVMNDETQRKYLQSVKRLMTFAQRVLPPSGPSKAVLNA